ncbi:hypothetical protein PFISCL1PPCAC_21816, partial [Pristionchus fissidentatus]
TELSVMLNTMHAVIYFGPGHQSIDSLLTQFFEEGNGLRDAEPADGGIRHLIRGVCTSFMNMIKELQENWKMKVVESDTGKPTGSGGMDGDQPCFSGGESTLQLGDPMFKEPSMVRSTSDARETGAGDVDDDQPSFSGATTAPRKLRLWNPKELKEEESSMMESTSDAREPTNSDRVDDDQPCLPGITQLLQLGELMLKEPGASIEAAKPCKEQSSVEERLDDT